MTHETTPSAAGGDNAGSRGRASDGRRAFSRRIECDGGGYSAGVAERARYDGMREPSGRERQVDPPR